MRFRWKIYFFIFAPLVIGNLVSIFSPDSVAYGYYHILMVFNPDYSISYNLAVISAIVNVVVLLPMYLFVFRIRFLPARLWQWLFVIRLAFDLAGHSYEIKSVQAFFHTDLLLTASAVFLGAVVIVPSYIACFRYAFRQQRIFEASSEN